MVQWKIFPGEQRVVFCFFCAKRAKQAEFPHLTVRKFSLFRSNIAEFYKTAEIIISRFPRLVNDFSALSLLMALVFGTNYHYFSVSFDYFALVAHRFYGRTNFHCYFSLIMFECFTICCAR